MIYYKIDQSEKIKKTMKVLVPGVTSKKKCPVHDLLID